MPGKLKNSSFLKDEVNVVLFIITNASIAAGVGIVFRRVHLSVCLSVCLFVRALTGQVAQLSLTNPRDRLHHDKRQNFKTVT